MEIIEIAKEEGQMIWREVDAIYDSIRDALKGLNDIREALIHMGIHNDTEQ